jgi:hypothetical protein
MYAKKRGRERVRGTFTGDKELSRPTMARLRKTQGDGAVRGWRGVQGVQGAGREGKGKVGLDLGLYRREKGAKGAPAAELSINGHCGRQL